MANLIPDKIMYSTLVRAPAETVYDGFATAQGLDGWFTQGSSIDARPGGHMRLRWHEFGADRVTEEANCLVLEARRGQRFVFQWKPDTADYATTVELDFEPVPDGTLVRVRETGYHDTPSGLRAMLNCSAGWGEALTLWKFYIEHGLRY